MDRDRGTRPAEPRTGRVPDPRRRRSRQRVSAEFPGASARRRADRRALHGMEIDRQRQRPVRAARGRSRSPTSSRARRSRPTKAGTPSINICSSTPTASIRSACNGRPARRRPCSASCAAAMPTRWCCSISSSSTANKQATPQCLYTDGDAWKLLTGFDEMIKHMVAANQTLLQKNPGLRAAAARRISQILRLQRAQHRGGRRRLHRVLRRRPRDAVDLGALSAHGVHLHGERAAAGAAADGHVRRGRAPAAQRAD